MKKKDYLSPECIWDIDLDSHLCEGSANSITIVTEEEIQDFFTEI